MTAETRPTVIIVHASRLLREGMARSLEADGAISVVGVAGAPEEAVRCTEDAAPDVVLLDPDLDGSTSVLIHRLRMVGPQAAVLVLGPSADPTAVVDADGYALRDGSVADLVDAIGVLASARLRATGTEPLPAPVVAPARIR